MALKRENKINILLAVVAHSRARNYIEEPSKTDIKLDMNS